MIVKCKNVPEDLNLKLIINKDYQVLNKFMAGEDWFYTILDENNEKVILNCKFFAVVSKFISVIQYNKHKDICTCQGCHIVDPNLISIKVADVYFELCDNCFVELCETLEKYSPKYKKAVNNPNSFSVADIIKLVCNKSEILNVDTVFIGKDSSELQISGIKSEIDDLKYLIDNEPYKLVNLEYVSFDVARNSGKKFRYKSWTSYYTLYEVLENLTELQEINRILNDPSWVIERDKKEEEK